MSDTAKVVVTVNPHGGWTIEGTTPTGIVVVCASTPEMVGERVTQIVREQAGRVRR